jgi:ketosteroid isomerase-like protein
MFDREAADLFAAEWIDAWNSHDLERILGHYSDDFEMCSPLIIERTGIETGKLKGKSAVRDYWKIGLESGELRFELKDVLIGVAGLTLVYANHRGQKVAETLIFGADGKIESGNAHYRNDD